MTEHLACLFQFHQADEKAVNKIVHANQPA